MAEYSTELSFNLVSWFSTVVRSKQCTVCLQKMSRKSTKQITELESDWKLDGLSVEYEPNKTEIDINYNFWCSHCKTKVNPSDQLYRWQKSETISAD